MSWGRLCCCAKPNLPIPWEPCNELALERRTGDPFGNWLGSAAVPVALIVMWWTANCAGVLSRVFLPQPLRTAGCSHSQRWTDREIILGDDQRYPDVDRATLYPVDETPC